jgi:hypothetical protein
VVTYNPTIDYVEELLRLRKTYVSSTPQSRLNIIRRRLSNDEIGPVRLVNLVSAVEALSRSLLVHLPGDPVMEAEKRYLRYKSKEGPYLVTEYLKRRGHAEPNLYFQADTWQLFKHAVNYRNLIAHECTYLGQDKYVSLIQASEEVLNRVAALGGLQDE